MLIPPPEEQKATEKSLPSLLSRRDILSVFASARRTESHTKKSGLHKSQTAGCFDCAFEIILRISCTGAFKGCFPCISDLACFSGGPPRVCAHVLFGQKKRKEKNINKRLVNVYRRAAYTDDRSHTDDRDYQIYFYIFLLCSFFSHLCS